MRLLLLQRYKLGCVVIGQYDTEISLKKEIFLSLEETFFINAT